MRGRVTFTTRSCLYPIPTKYGNSHQKCNINISTGNSPSSASELAVKADSLKKRENGKLKEKLEERDLFLNVLSATTTRRDAKSYLSRFKTLSGESTPLSLSKADPGELHLSLFKLRAPQELSDETISGLAHTLSQLSLLGLSSAVVLDCDLDGEQNAQNSSGDIYYEQGQRLVSSLLKGTRGKAFYLDSCFSVSTSAGESQPNVAIYGEVEVQYPHILHRMLSSSAIPIIPAIAYSMESQRVVAIQPDDVLLALARELSQFRAFNLKNSYDSKSDEGVTEPNSRGNPSQRVILDRIMLLDPQGGIPSLKRLGRSHSFVNLEQEYQEIKKELMTWNFHETTTDSGNFVNEPLVELRVQQEKLDRSVQNLDLVHKALGILPASTSALITTPWEAATPPPSTILSTPDLGVKTRRARNPLIYNLLTDKALVSSSLPNTRLGYFGVSQASMTESSSSTFIKRGMPLTIIPDPRTAPWRPPQLGEQTLTLDDPRIDFSRLLNLIEDSFNRPLDVKHYLDRIKNRVAGIIVAGEYEGGAILTWELPSNVPDDGSDESRQRMVPYLDKFAVLKRSQGAGGVADMVFTAMVFNCFPEGVCWRSRENNPVNKWYFERSVGTWKLHDSQWAMFWTTRNLLRDKQKFLDYENVCRRIAPSWADNKHVAD